MGDATRAVWGTRGRPGPPRKAFTCGSGLAHRPSGADIAFGRMDVGDGIEGSDGRHSVGRGRSPVRREQGEMTPCRPPDQTDAEGVDIEARRMRPHPGEGVGDVVGGILPPRRRRKAVVDVEHHVAAVGEPLVPAGDSAPAPRNPSSTVNEQHGRQSPASSVPCSAGGGPTHVQGQAARQIGRVGEHEPLVG